MEYLDQLIEIRKKHKVSDALFIGIDTSCYTTSIAVAKDNGTVIFSKRIILQVQKGTNGLRQSEAVFQHINNISKLVETLSKSLNLDNLKAVCSSCKPRPTVSSYMPVFRVGENIGKVLSSVRNVPFFCTSHQENHIMSSFHFSNVPKEDFVIVHLSGGTTELLKVSKELASFSIQSLGSSLDINAGQLIDRIGVMLGGSFPAGIFMENLAQKSNNIISIPSYEKDLNISFSGAETRAKSLISDDYSNSDVARSVYNCISNTLIKWLIKASSKHHINNVLFTGGVSSSNTLRKMLRLRAENRCRNLNLFFAEPSICTDNAVGTALLCLEKYKLEV